jgi:aspartate kinase
VFNYQLKGKEKDVLNAIRKRCDVDELSIEHDLAILMIVALFIPSPTIIKIAKSCSILNSSTSQRLRIALSTLAILMIVGEGMNKAIGTANTITHALAESNINLKIC